jgi:hypothetical protein
MTLTPYDYDKGPPPPCADAQPMSQLPPTYTPDSRDEELENLKELLAEAEEACLLLAFHKHLELQRIQKKIELLSRERQEEEERRAKRGIERT